MKTTRKIQLKEFTRATWMTWAGCEEFSNGDEPMIAEWEGVDSNGFDALDYYDVTIIVDGNGVTGYLYKEDDEDYGDDYGLPAFYVPMRDKALAVTIAESLIKELDNQAFAVVKNRFQALDKAMGGNGND